MNIKAFAALAIATTIACSGNNDDNSQTNNATANNTTANNTTANNTTANNTTANNTANNNTANNTVTNRFGLSGDCLLESFDDSGDGTVDRIRVQQGGKPAADRGNWGPQIAHFVGSDAVVTDNDGDGEFDEASRSTYDADGHELTRDVDLDGDGTPDRFGEFTYDANGNRLTWVVTDADGGELIRHVSTYDAAGQLLSHQEDGVDGGDGTRPDGSPHYRETRAWVGDLPSLIEVDADGDGVLEMQLTAEFHANGRPTSRTRDGLFDFTARTVIRPMDGVPDEQETYIRDANGVLLGLESDGDVGPNREQADGTPDIIQRTFTRNAADELIYFESDGRGDVTNDIATLVADGTFDSYTLEWTNGYQTSFVIDEGIDASDDIVINRTFNADGGQLTERRDGVWDNNNIISEPADGTDDWILTVSWYAPDDAASVTVDADGDGTDDVIGEKEYVQTQFRIFETARRWDGSYRGNELANRANGTWDIDFTWTYDDQGRPLTETLLQSGNPFGATTWEYGRCSDFL